MRKLTAILTSATMLWGFISCKKMDSSQYSEPLLHIYGNISDRMNSADLSYERNTNTNSDDAKYYVAATVNNALYDFDEYATQDGIMPSPNGIKYWFTIFIARPLRPCLQHWPEEIR